MTINRHSMVDYVDGVIAATTDEKHLQMLRVLRAHMAAETAGDVDALMATISLHRVQYRTWGAPEDLSPSSREGVAEFYRQRRAQGMLYLEYDIERLTMGDDILITDGITTMLMPGTALAQMGWTDADPASVHELTSRMCISWPFDESGLLIGEETYAVPLAMRALEPGEVPTDFVLA
jgi:hypothetical protein